MPTGPDPATPHREMLQQARTRTLAKLQTACSPLDRAALESALAELDRRLTDVAAAPKTSND